MLHEHSVGTKTGVSLFVLSRDRGNSKAKVLEAVSVLRNADCMQKLFYDIIAGEI